MFVRKKKNKSGSISIQIIDKSSGKYKVVKTVGSSKDPNRINYLSSKAYYKISELSGQQELSLLTSSDNQILHFLKNNDTLKVRVIGPELILGELYNKIGFKSIKDELLRHLVITRIVYPGSKLKTVDYIHRYTGRLIDLDKVYRFLDKLNNKYKSEVEEIVYNYTHKELKENISIVFYDITSLYFEASEEDDLRKIGFSKDGKTHLPQILLGLLLGLEGYPIGYDIFAGNKFEGHTIIPVLDKYKNRLKTEKIIVVADSAMLSEKNIEKLKAKKYQYILGGRIKNEPEYLQEKILQKKLSDGESIEFKRTNKDRLIVSYSSKRAKNDQYNRKRGLRRLEKSLQSNRLTKKHINNRGYNKYLRLKGKLHVEIDYDKFEEDSKWDGLKGYITNSTLSRNQIIENYSELWQIEKAFRISKTDLMVRPIYHHIEDRIEAHILIAFVAYTVIKELEKLIAQKDIPFSVNRVIELTKTIYALDFVLPDSKKKESIILPLDDEQKIIIDRFNIII